LTVIEWYLIKGQKDVSATDLMIKSLIKLNITAFDELINLSGKAETLAAVKNYRIQSGPVIVNEAKKVLPVVGNGPDALLLSYAFASMTTTPSENVTGEVKERGAVGVNQDCCFKNASPEYCTFLSHFSSQGVADYLNPNYECIFTHKETNGDPYCRYVFKKKSDPFSVVNDLGRTVMVLPKFEVPKEKAQAGSLWALAVFLDNISRAFVDLHGVNKTREVLCANANKIGRELGKGLREQRPELIDDLEAMGKFVQSMQNGLGQKDNLVIVSENEVTNEITDCSQQIWSAELCKQYESFFDGLVNAFNPNFELKYQRMMTLGEKTCFWTLKRLAPTKKTDDPAKILRVRLAKGEISKEEYKELKALLEDED
jgi:predicted hydrocarbon binding protein